ncbi:pyroglutamyl-peptidase I [Deinococcus maricopensis]|uniref:Pyroglutamyl-peptidase I n=1 Tax=Deinococcus maricopensis (strain DSM 21211 / LMG 22137 / NRRL B-23946 / LB-34) TaxID=709986 RepID=E8UA86_DEIML|nr:pyroglutamyl-peptidase I [Deinococcus maricopensis]ADV67975.1 Pyroglutamyl-peptidase I [Deinococcus maricopensis DSM 21211]
MRLLLTGFEAFGGDRVNPTEAVVAALHGQVVAGAQVIGAVLPVDAARAPGAVRALLDEHQPDAVLLTGVARGRAQLALERVAVNVQDAALPDNAGRRLSGEPVVPGAPDAYLSTLPLPDVLAAWRAHGLPGYVSNTAGLYLCNAAMFAARHHLGERVPCGFLHVPANEWMALDARPGEVLAYLPQAEIERGVRVALAAVAAGVRAPA